MKLALARDLRARRLERRLNQTQVARIVGSSQSRVAKMEAADPTVSVDLLIRTLAEARRATKGRRQSGVRLQPVRGPALLTDFGILLQEPTCCTNHRRYLTPNHPSHRGQQQFLVRARAHSADASRWPITTDPSKSA